MANCSWNVILFIVLILRLISAYENIALNKPAYQQHPSTESYLIIGNASKAVDGLKSDKRASGGQCVVSENRKHSATWWVDLTEVSCISHITVYYMTGNEEWGPLNEFTREFLGFSIYVSNTTERSEGVLCFKDSKLNKITIPNVFNITCSVHGRYVIFYNERQEGISYPDDYSKFAFNDLCEVEVYGLDNCSILCSDRNCHCCNNGSKVCQECKPGYQGKHCEIELDEKKGEFKKRCGYCSDLSKCNYASSTCLNERRSDKRQDYNIQENQFTNAFESRTTTIGILILLFLIFISALLVMMIFLYLRKGKKHKGYRTVPCEEPSEEDKSKEYKQYKQNEKIEMDPTKKDKDNHDGCEENLRDSREDTLSGHSMEHLPRPDDFFDHLPVTK